MEILRFEGSSRVPLKQKKSFRVILGITVMGVFAALGSTLAANITINSGPVEFGQGLAAASACDGSITVTPTSSFTNSSDTAGTFYLAGIVFAGVDTRTAACGGKEFVINAYDSGTTTANYLGRGASASDSYTAITVNVVDTTVSTAAFNVSDMSGAKPSITSRAGGFTLTFDTPIATAGSIYKVTVESRGNT
ncbi:MAG: hypothetical protein EBY01_00430 [Actinobacteria bacterium]|jgi:hypothetical protein|nr:hypothetical protein [Actinomycetota bacterium]NDI09959.1 hypothetical protein [Actinomycetota bacterium]